MQPEVMEDSVAVAVQPAEVIPNDSSAQPRNVIPNDSSAQPRNHCPLCNAIIRPFFINFNEKMLMCVNTECIFPYGCEELQFFKEDNDKLPHEELMCRPSKGSGGSPTATSDISTAAWSEIDRLFKTYKAEDTQFESQSFSHRSKKDSAEKIDNDRLPKHLYDFKELTVDEQVPKVNIRNEKWINNLLQEVSGVQLLNKEEIELLRKDEPHLDIGELKIDINPDDEACLSTEINIEIHNAKASTSSCKALNDIPI